MLYANLNLCIFCFVQLSILQQLPYKQNWNKNLIKLRAVHFFAYATVVVADSWLVFVAEYSNEYFLAGRNVFAISSNRFLIIDWKLDQHLFLHSQIF
jgi:hypothetical protein